MKHFVCQILLGGNIVWQQLQGQHDEGLGVALHFVLGSQRFQREAEEFLEGVLRRNEIKWLSWKPQGWDLDVEAFRQSFEILQSDGWLKGQLTLKMDFQAERRDEFGRVREHAYGEIVVRPSDVERHMPKRVFLSHRGVDKPMVRRFHKALEQVGFQPWLDEDAMAAGVKLERGLLQGFHESCAAVFFVTANYRDSGYLGTEIDYAIAEERTKGDRFKIVTLVFADADHVTPEVPDLLRAYVWKTCVHELDAFAEIVRALPLRVEGINWK
ncbi:conserved hypothetical protein [Methylocella tundrae]|uniref:TIR domain-containing protein n=1 Tax=Methylocella tundrae TaxID=227605 RepID=A0A8B6M4G7_METTU|nr:toll/interleukin-1 receptor domain-containing protein [Methylocella tundrae]VTZ25372.1 conserved hypothetical protein [Methylocella tundrae]VTZ49705.1 conserved hypothetical protein [Methylocella tundrae]